MFFSGMFQESLIFLECPPEQTRHDLRILRLRCTISDTSNPVASKGPSISQVFTMQQVSGSKITSISRIFMTMYLISISSYICSTTLLFQTKASKAFNIFKSSDVNAIPTIFFFKASHFHSISCKKNT